MTKEEIEKKCQGIYEELKLCKDCLYFKGGGQLPDKLFKLKDYYDYSTCEREEFVQYSLDICKITGKKTQKKRTAINSCHDQRRKEQDSLGTECCGRDAKYFKPKKAPEFIKKPRRR
jgi:hypothetical protein